MIGIRIILTAMLVFVVGLLGATAQENNSATNRISIDFGGGYPIYYGDFYPLNTALDPILRAPVQFNQSHIAAGVNIPLFNFLDMRIEASQTTVYYSDETTPVNFKNTALDFSGQLKWNIINRRIGTYLLTGAGVNFHNYPKDIIGSTSVTDPDYTENVRRLSVTGGLGLQFWITDRFGIFAEGIAQLPGSDYFDGYTRPPSGPIDAGEKSYIQRDLLLSGRGGIRFRLFEPTKPVSERSVDDPVSSFVPDPDATDEDLKDGKVEEKKEVPSIYEELGIKQSLSGYTLYVHHVRTIEELKRQKETAEQMLDRLFPNRKSIEVLLLDESEGFSMHFGYFNNREDARNYRDDVLQYYSGALVRRYL